MSENLNLEDLTQQDEVLRDMIADRVGKPEKSSDGIVYTVVGAKLVGRTRIFNRCCGQGMLILKDIIEHKSPKGKTFKSVSLDKIFYWTECGRSYDNVQFNPYG